jgi:hypothetical protein
VSMRYPVTPCQYFLSLSEQKAELRHSPVPVTDKNGMMSLDS